MKGARSLVAVLLVGLLFLLGSPVLRLVVIPGSWLLPGRRHWFVTWFMKGMCAGLWAVLRLGGARVRRVGVLPTGSQVLVVANHQGLLDILQISLLAQPRVPAFVTRRRYSRFVPLVSACIRLLGSHSRHPATVPKGLVVLLHGWEGSIDSTYMRCTGRALYRRGYDLFRLNYRDHGCSHRLNEGIFYAVLLDEVFEAVAQAAALAAVRQRADALAAPLYRLGEQFHTRREPGGTFTYRGIGHVWHGLATGLEGAHQVANAALVLAACELLMAHAPKMDLAHIRAGLRENRWPGRLERVSENPLVIFDGAHNLDAARQLSRYVAAHFKGLPITLVIGILDDKPYRAMLKLLAPLAIRVIATQATINRALPAQRIAETVRPLAREVTVIADVAKALRHAVKTASPDGLTLVAGSLYVVGEAKAAVARGFVRFKRLT